MSDAYLEPIVTAVAAYIIKKIIEKIVTGVSKRETARIQKQLLEFFPDVAIQGDDLAVSVHGVSVVVSWKHSGQTPRTDFFIRPKSGAELNSPAWPKFNIELEKSSCPCWQDNPTPADFREKKMLDISFDDPQLRERLMADDELLEIIGKAALTSAARLPVSGSEPGGVIHELTRSRSISLFYSLHASLEMNTDVFRLSIKTEKIREPARIREIAILCANAFEHVMKFVAFSEANSISTGEYMAAK